MKIVATEEGSDNEIRHPIVRAASVVEQRVSHFLMGLGIIGTMTGPLLIVLHTMPRALSSGVFFVVGVRCIPLLTKGPSYFKISNHDSIQIVGFD